MNKEITIDNICNNNSTNMPTNDIYQDFNNFIFSNDIKLIGKLLHRFMFFEKTKHLAGDIVELGVFKGSGVATFMKFIEIFCTHSNKKVIGFDIFDAQNTITSNYKHGNTMDIVYRKVNTDDLTIEAVEQRLEGTQVSPSKYILVKGDVCITANNFCKENPGFRISLIYVDLDLSEPVYNSLCSLWSRLLPGGYIVFDEYEYHKFDESNGVDRFLRDNNMDYEVISTNWIAPTAYMIKKNVKENN